MRGWYRNKYGHSLASRGVRIKSNAIQNKEYIWSYDNINEEKINQIIDVIKTIRDCEVEQFKDVYLDKNDYFSSLIAQCGFITDAIEEISGGRKVDGWVYDKNDNTIINEDELDEWDAWHHSWIVLKDGTIIDPTFLQFYVDGFDVGNCSDDYIKCFGKIKFKCKTYPRYMIAIIPKNHSIAKIYSSHRNNYENIDKKLIEIQKNYKEKIRNEGFDIP